jgi:ADP-ribosylglycohydrolase
MAILSGIIGDIVGSRFEKRESAPEKFRLFTKNSRFTDDTVLTVAVADAILSGISYERKIKQYYCKYPHHGYGKAFKAWATTKENTKNDSWGNGAPMRVSPIGYAFNSSGQVLREARNSARNSHCHSSAIKGAQAVAFSIFMIRMGAGKKDIKRVMEDRFAYDLSKIHTCEEVGFSCTSDFTVPQSLAIFLQTDSFEECIRKSVWVGGDTDTTACISGSIAGAYYRIIPYKIQEEALAKLPRKFIAVLDKFTRRYIK